jgi:hypothetical protein
MPAYVVVTKTRTRNPSELELYAKEAPTFMAGHPASNEGRDGFPLVLHLGEVATTVATPEPFPLAQGSLSRSGARKPTCDIS